MTLYHYTTAAALQSIISTKSLWVSDHRFLNDPTEFLYGWEIVSAALASRKDDIARTSPLAQHTIERFLDHNERERAHAFVGSLTSQGDLLSQWRGYSGGRGFSIGFNEEWLQENATAQDFHLVRVLYEAGSQRAAAEDVVNSLLPFVANYSGRSSTPEDIEKLFRGILSWWMQALKVALSFKNEHFAEEQETRLIWTGTSWPTGLKTRIREAALVPYKPFKFDEVMNPKISYPNNVGIEEVIVGPAARRQQIAAVDALLASNKMRLSIRSSSIPYVAD
jgi:hypothetical protein